MGQESIYKPKIKFSFPKPNLGEIPLYLVASIYITTMAFLASTLI
jgi:hypothetical protein